MLSDEEIERYIEKLAKEMLYPKTIRIDISQSVGKSIHKAIKEKVLKEYWKDKSN